VGSGVDPGGLLALAGGRRAGPWLDAGPAFCSGELPQGCLALSTSPRVGHLLLTCAKGVSLKGPARLVSEVNAVFCTPTGG